MLDNWCLYHRCFYYVSVAGCLGYDVLASRQIKKERNTHVSVAGCLGYDVLEGNGAVFAFEEEFQLLVV